MCRSAPRRLLPHLAGVTLDRVEQTPDLIRLHAHPRATNAACPACGSTSIRVHSRYRRRLADTALGTRRTVIDLHVRRFFCDTPACEKRTFAEQITGLTTPYARRTPVLRHVLEKIAIDLADRPGARLARLLGLLIGRSTMLRLSWCCPTRPPPHPVSWGSTTSRCCAAISTARSSSTATPAPPSSCWTGARPNRWPPGCVTTRGWR
ncbi:hypothetical protein HNR23_004309 [Nocardiopsis mwathae]|uniref:Transposase IS204/IS1001/IS1096/IS1165 zinc-finger domain-containing protein n=1 Tax=Nocardiopsis mwathae TaxID=1472723 RepID=A0A7W9YLB0_9ACTN|nr:hypothetical protein [Nocardiopsis mwathae]